MTPEEKADENEKRAERKRCLLYTSSAADYPHHVALVRYPSHFDWFYMDAYELIPVEYAHEY